MARRRYPIDTRIMINGMEAYDKASDLAAGHPTVLDQLSLTWGRDSTVDQPDVGTCTFTMREQLQEPTPELILGRNLAPDPSFEYGVGGLSGGGAGNVVRDTTRRRTGRASVRLDTLEPGTYNPSLSIYGTDSPLLPGDTVSARVWVWVPSSNPLLPLSEWSANRGTKAILDDPTHGDVLEWTAGEDKRDNAALSTSPDVPVSASDDDLVGSVWLAKGNSEAPDRVRILILCYGDSGYLGPASLPGADNQNFAITDDWSRLDIPAIQAMPDTTSVRMGLYAVPSGYDYQAGDKIKLAAPILQRGNETSTRPQLRIGGNGITGTNSPDFTGPYGTWTPIEVSAPVNVGGSSAVLYMYGNETSGRPIWFDDLSITVNADHEDFSGDTPPEHPGSITPTFQPFGEMTKRDTYEAWPLLYETPTGAWLLAYKSSGSHMPVTPARSIVLRSTDEGRSWSLVSSIGDGVAAVGGTQIAIGRDDSLTLITTWNTSGAQGENDGYRLYRSTDDGLTWTEQARYDWPEVATFGKPLTLASGDLLASWHGQGWGMIRSTDNGLSWTLYGTANGGPWGREGRMVQAHDGTLILTSRNNRLDVHYSHDDGYTWTRGVDSEITPPPPAGTDNTFTHSMAIFRHWLEIVWHSRDDMKIYYTYAPLESILADPTAWTPSVELGQLAAAGSGDLGYPSMLHRNNGALFLAWYADPERNRTPSVYTGITRLNITAGPGEQYRWTATPGQSASEKFLPPTSGTPMLDAVRPGGSVAVWARAGEIPPDDNEVMIDTQFRDLGRLTQDRWNADLDLDVTVASRVGRQAVWVSQPDLADWSGAIVFPPAPYAPVGREPDAWDHIPRLLPGQSWTIMVAALLPEGAEAYVTAWAATDPHRDAPATKCLISYADPEGPAEKTSGRLPPDHRWTTVSATVTLPADFDQAGAWILPGVKFVQMPSMISWSDADRSWAAQPRAWQHWQAAGINEVSVYQAEYSARDVLVWSGTMTTVNAQAAGDEAVTIDVTASDPSQPLANETIGDETWPVQTADVRVNRILRLSRQDALLDMIMDPTLAHYELTRRDVDAQAVLGLLHDVADSVGGVLWVAEHSTSGTYLWLEDPAQRAAVRKFQIDPITGVITIDGTVINNALLSAGDILRDPLTLSKDTTAVITSVDATWQEQGTDDDGKPTVEDRTVTRTDDQTLDQYGLQKLQVDTELINESDAADLADRHLARARGVEWQFQGVTIDGRVMERPNEDVDDPARLNTMIDILDGTRRLGLPITILDLPSWVRAEGIASGYLEGGDYTLNDGRWDCRLTVTPSIAQGDSATWEQMPQTILWADMHPNVTWALAYGVVAPDL